MAEEKNIYKYITGSPKLMLGPTGGLNDYAFKVEKEDDVQTFASEEPFKSCIFSKGMRKKMAVLDLDIWRALPPCIFVTHHGSANSFEQPHLACH